VQLICAAARARTGARVVVSERVALRENIRTHWLKRLFPPLIRWVYPRADRIVAVSAALAAEVAEVGRLRRDRVDLVYNPVVTAPMLEDGPAPTDDWFRPGDGPIVLSAARLVPQKDCARWCGRSRSCRNVCAWSSSATGPSEKVWSSLPRSWGGGPNEPAGIRRLADRLPASRVGLRAELALRRPRQRADRGAGRRLPSGEHGLPVRAAMRHRSRCDRFRWRRPSKQGFAASNTSTDAHRSGAGTSTR